jgi:hypothetical protein
MSITVYIEGKEEKTRKKVSIAAGDSIEKVFKSIRAAYEKEGIELPNMELIHVKLDATIDKASVLRDGDVLMIKTSA